MRGGAQAGIAEILGRLDPELPMADVKTMEQVVSQSLAADRFYTVFLGAFAAVALVLAAVGIYGVMSFVVAQRTHEIGLRMALGAGRGQVLAQVLREGMTTALAGTAVGAAGAVLRRPHDAGVGVRRGFNRPRSLLRSRAGPVGRGARGMPAARPPRRVGGSDGRAAARLAACAECASLRPQRSMPLTIQPPNVPEADVLVPRRWWVTGFGWTWAVLMLFALAVAIVDNLVR